MVPIKCSNCNRPIALIVPGDSVDREWFRQQQEQGLKVYLMAPKQSLKDGELFMWELADMGKKVPLDKVHFDASVAALQRRCPHHGP